MDCTWFAPGVKKGNNGCLGGWTWKAFSWIKKFGLATTESYGHYRGQVYINNSLQYNEFFFNSYLALFWTFNFNINIDSDS